MSSSPPPPNPRDAKPRNAPAFNIPPATLWTGLVLGAMFLVLRFAPNDWVDQALYILAFDNIPFRNAWSRGDPGILDLTPLLTHGFVHLDTLHLVLNLGLLIAFGAVVERIHGKFIYCLIFVTAIIAGALIQTLASGGRELVMIGASGGVYGLIGAAIPIIFWSRGGFRWRGGLGFVVVLMMINVIIGPLSSVFDLFGARIAWEAHIGGFVIGLIFGFWIFFYRLRQAGNHP